jgi:DNA (cytosine-5)-methyltransferase 1
VNYYNENDPKAAAWLRELIRQGCIPDGVVDERSIVDVKASDLNGYTQHHFFAGIGGWSHALALAGWPITRPVATGSCPCQPFSNAGKGLGTADERHLWPVFRQLIAECRFPVVFGEQVASAAGRDWLAGVRADLEALDYVTGGADLCAAGVGAPHIRQRLFWVADRNSAGWGGRRMDESHRLGGAAGLSGSLAGHEGLAGVTYDAGGEDRPSGGGRVVWLVHAKQPGLEGHRRHEDDRNQSRWVVAESARSASETGATGFWSHCQLLDCTDGKTRRAEPGVHPLANGIPGRVGLLRGYGNAIVPQVAEQFIRAYDEILAM